MKCRYFLTEWESHWTERRMRMRYRGLEAVIGGTVMERSCVPRNSFYRGISWIFI